MTFLQDALKTFEAEGWTELQLKTLRDLSDCYRKLGEQEKLGRALVQMASIAEEKGKPFDDFLALAPSLGKFIHSIPFSSFINAELLS